ncbi:MAG TPA: CapA family protein [Actinomycetaceae bacterium]|nr:CapA family protein [Actinomycetaceae bacterium]
MARHSRDGKPNYPLRRTVAATGLIAVVGGGVWLGMSAFAGAGGTPGDAQEGVAATAPAAGGDGTSPGVKGAEEPVTAEESAAPAPSEDPVVFKLMMAGDVLPHATVNRNASLPDGSYDYAPMMANVLPWIEYADIALCSLEVPLAPPGTEVSAYPVFGAPEGLISSLQAVGWDGCATATNHSLDRGVAGLEYTLEIMDEVGLGHAGTGRSPEETVSPQFYEVEKDGQVLTIAHLSATTFHNGYTEPSQYARSLHALDAHQIDAQAAAARESGADVVVFTPHWGQEYWANLDGLQQDISATLAAGGNVDVVLGGHPHVPQVIEMLPGGASGEGMWVAYSMGNFLSNQDEKCCVVATATGLLVTAEIALDPASGEAKVTGVTWAGSTVDTEGRQRLHPIQSLANGERPEGLTLSGAKIDSRWNNLIGQMGEENHDPAPPQEPSDAVVTVVPRG